ncbi:MAG: hypothetical protein V4552_02615 [Pseudomonadota bacterium]
MNELDSDELARLVSDARKSRGGKPAKYPQLEIYGVSIVKLLECDVQLPFILKWLIEEKNEDLVLNTLRKYVVRKIGRDAYEDYLKRNGWMKNKRTTKATSEKTALTTETIAQEKSTPLGLGFDLDFEKPATFKRTERK